MIKLLAKIRNIFRDQTFLNGVHHVENFVSKILSAALILVILVSIGDLIIILARDLIKPPTGFFNKTIIDIFGLFLNVLIALELLENITAYLRKHIVQVELVIVTALIAVARKIIIFDTKNFDAGNLIALGVAILSLSISYLLIKIVNPSK